MRLKWLDRPWRITAAAISYTTFGIVAIMVSLALVVLYPIPLSAERKQRWVRRTISGCFWFFVREMRFLGLLHFRYDEVDPIADAGQLIVANHPTLLDTVFLLSLAPKANCIVKAALFTNPFTRLAVKQAGYIPNNSQTLVDEAARAIQRGESVLVFPEGTRTRPGETLQFTRGPAHIALRAACPIQPVLIGCDPGSLRKGDHWYDMPSRPSLFTFTPQAKIKPANVIDTARPTSIQARHLTRHLEDRYHQWLTDIGQHPHDAR